MVRGDHAAVCASECGLSACLSTKESLDNGRREMGGGRGRQKREGVALALFRDANADREELLYVRSSLMGSNQISKDS